MDEADFELAYELLAEVLDTVEGEDEAAFLTRLALLAARECGDIERFRALVRAAREAGPPLRDS